MTSKLKELIKTYAKEPKTDVELERGARILVGFAKCLVAMKQEILENESSNTNQSINQDAGRRFEFSSSKS